MLFYIFVSTLEVNIISLILKYEDDLQVDADKEY